MKQVYFFLIQTDTGYVRSSPCYDSLEYALETRRNWDTTYETIISPVMMGYQEA